MTTKSEKKHSDQTLDNKPVDPLGQVNKKMLGEPEQAPSQISDKESAEGALGELGDLLEPMEPLSISSENGEIGDSGSPLSLEEPAEPSSNEPVDPLDQTNEKVPEEPNEASAISSLRTLVSSEAMLYQGDVESDGTDDYATEPTEPDPDDPMIDDVLGQGDPKGTYKYKNDPDGEEEGISIRETSAKSKLRPGQSSSNNKTIIKVLGSVALAVIIVALVLVFSGALQPTAWIPILTRLPSFLSLSINLPTPTSSAATNPQVETAAQAWLDAPLNDSLLPFAPVDVTSHFYHPSGVKQIELSIDGSVLRTDPSPDTKTGFVYLTQKWSPPVPGTYRLSVRAQSNSGDWGDTANITVTVGEVITVTPSIPAQPITSTITSTPARAITIPDTNTPQVVTQTNTPVIVTRPPTNTATNTAQPPTRPPTDTAQPPTRPPTNTPQPPTRPPTNTPTRR